MSSANWTNEQFSLVDPASDVYKVNKNYAKTVPCGAPVFEIMTSDMLLDDLMLTYWDLFVR